MPVAGPRDRIAHNGEILGKNFFDVAPEKEGNAPVLGYSVASAPQIALVIDLFEGLEEHPIGRQRFDCGT